PFNAPIEASRVSKQIKGMGDEKWLVPVIIKITGQSNNKNFFINPSFFEKIASTVRGNPGSERQTLRMTMEPVDAEFKLNTRSDLVQTTSESDFMEKEKIEKIYIETFVIINEPVKRIKKKSIYNAGILLFDKWNFELTNSTDIQKKLEWST
ncbi:hypothetical protein LCGC14_3070860, partial [marine sediment metagenome]